MGGEYFGTKVDLLDVRVYPTRALMGAAAAADCADFLRGILAGGRRGRAIFAAAPSQSELLEALVAAPGIDWSAVEAFHMDDYLGLPPDAPQSFGVFMRERLFGRLPFGSVHYILPASPRDRSIPGPAEEYAALLSAAPIDLVCLGVGENGHIAFNDPPVADFNDPFLVKKVRLDDDCRRQQVNDGCFPDFGSVPEFALTLTIPALTRARRLFCVVPGPSKAKAIRAMLEDPVSEACPAGILRRHPACTLYLDRDSAADWLAGSGV